MTNPKYILGISAFYHDSAAVLLKDDDIIAAVQEERFSRIKFDANFPINSIKFCLKSGKINEEKIDAIAFYENPYLKYLRIKENQKKYFPFKIFNNFKKIKNWLETKYDIQNYIINYLPNFKGKLFFLKHHLSHASSAFYPSPFKDASILTIDGVGEYSTSSIFFGYENKINEFEEQLYPHSLGLLYSSFTRFLGFKVLSGEYKLMGLAPYGEPILSNKIKNHLIEIQNNGSIKLNLDYFNFINGKEMISNKFEDLFECKIKKSDELFTKQHMDIASSIQNVLEEIIIKMVKYCVKMNNSNNLTLAGGVALNCVANSKIIKNVKKINNIWIQPASGDAGGALGAAFYILYNNYNFYRKLSNNKDKQKNSLLGPQYSEEEIENSLISYSLKFEKLNSKNYASVIAKLLNNGKIIALFNGKTEFGPRALGNRSIIGDPRNIEMQQTMNLKIKYRESFRPFAPVILEEKAKEWFEINHASPYMLFTSNIRNEKKIKLSKDESNFVGFDKLKVKRSLIPAVTHVDYSARVQTVNSRSNPNLYSILKEFNKLTNCPVLINTSFNVRGEPIVNNIYDALSCFFNTEIDYLVIGNFLLNKENNKSSFFENLDRKFDAD